VGDPGGGVADFVDVAVVEMTDVDVDGGVSVGMVYGVAVKIPKRFRKGGATSGG
jgi:hypothetical protein